MGRMIRSEDDRVRATRWRAGLVEDLGEDMRRLVGAWHDVDPSGLVVVLRGLRHCGVSATIQQGVSLYWRQLTVEKRTGQPLQEGAF